MARVTSPWSVCMLVIYLFVFGAGCDPKKANIAKPPDKKDQAQQKPDGDEPVHQNLALMLKDRRLVLEDLRSYLRSNYTFQAAKALSVDKIIQFCLAEETRIGAKEVKSEFMNLAFEDRLLRCVALFFDGHLIPKHKNPKLVSGFTVREIQGRFYVESISANKHFHDFYQSTYGLNLLTILAPGTEVISVDGKFLEDWVKDLGTYIAASSERYRREMAIQSVFERDFRYPDKNEYELKIVDNETKQPRTIKIRWFYDRVPSNSLALKYLAKVQIKPVYMALPPRPVEKNKEGIQAEKSSKTEVAPKDIYLLAPGDFERKFKHWYGYQDRASLFPEGSIEYYGQDRNVIVRFSKASVFPDISACYLQLLAFQEGAIFNPILGGGSIEKVLQNHIQECEKESKPLVLDLRYNDGGETELAARLMSMVSAAGKQYPPMFFSGLLTYNFKKFNLNFDFGPDFLTGKEKMFHPTLRAKAAEKAVKEKLAYLPMVSSGNIVAAEGASFNQKLVVLISPQCFSACDIFADFIKKSGRGVLVGTQTSGAFGTMAEWKTSSVRAIWVDQRFNIFSLQVPNAITGIMNAPLADGEVLINFSPQEHMPENKPVLASKGGEYETALIDLAFNPNTKTFGSGWLTRAMGLLRGGPSPAVSP